MQHDNDKPRRRRRSTQGKGYYIALVLCIAAVGISGYVFIRAARNSRQTVQEAQVSMNVPVTPDTVPEDGGDPQSQPRTNAADAAGVSDALTPAQARAEEAAPAVQAETPDAEAAQAASVLDTLEEPAVLEFDPSDAQLCWPVSGLVTDSYSMEALVYNATMGDWRVHEGVDISADTGSQVLCACAGTVTAVYADDMKGTVVVVDHGGGYETLYANLDEATLVTAGQAVQAGTPLGYVGTSALGESAGDPHLHLEVYYDGTLIDPVDFLP